MLFLRHSVCSQCSRSFLNIYYDLEGVTETGVSRFSRSGTSSHKSLTSPLQDEPAVSGDFKRSSYMLYTYLRAFQDCSDSKLFHHHLCPPLTPHKSPFSVPPPLFRPVSGENSYPAARPLLPLCIMCLFMCFLRLVMGMDW